MLVEEYLGKERKLYAACMDLEAYDRVDREALWNVLKICGVGGQLMEGIKAFYREANACVKVDGELSNNFAVRVGVRQGCVMSPWLFNPFRTMTYIQHHVLLRAANHDIHTSFLAVAIFQVTHEVTEIKGMQ